MTAATHVAAAVIIWPEMVDNGLEKMVIPGFKGPRIEGTLKNVDDVFHY